MHAEAEVWVGHARSTSRQEPEQRLAVALDALYGWYERTEGMLANVLRDQEAMPILREIGAWGVAYLAELEELVVRGWGACGHRARMVRRAVALALDFGAWRTLRARDLARDDGPGPRDSGPVTDLVSR